MNLMKNYLRIGSVIADPKGRTFKVTLIQTPWYYYLLEGIAAGLLIGYALAKWGL